MSPPILDRGLPVMVGQLGVDEEGLERGEHGSAQAQ